MNIPLAVPNLSGREGEYLQQCIESSFVSTAGPFVGEFANRIADVSGTASAVVTCSGTVALQMALEGLGVGTNDLVIAPSLTFIATANAIVHSGAKPWLFDVSEDDWTLDLDLIADELERNTGPAERGRRHFESSACVRVIMPVMTLGASVDLDRYVELARIYDLHIVVDAAAAIGGTDYQGRPLGASGVDAVCYSFNGNKTITSGGGGAVASADDDLIQKVSHLISTGRVGENYDHDIVAYNFRMTNLEAAVGLAQFEQLDVFLGRKLAIAASYAELASGFEALAPFPHPPKGKSVFWFSGVQYLGSDIDEVDRFIASMRTSGIDVRPFWKPIHQQIPYSDALRTPMPVTDRLWRRIIPLPCSTGITDNELNFTLEAVARFWGGNG